MSRYLLRTRTGAEYRTDAQEPFIALMSGRVVQEPITFMNVDNGKMVVMPLYAIESITVMEPAGDGNAQARRRHSIDETQVIPPMRFPKSGTR